MTHEVNNIGAENLQQTGDGRSECRPSSRAFFVARVRFFRTKARFPAIGNATQRNAPYRNATQVPLRRSASVRKQIEKSFIFFRSPQGRSNQSEQPTALT